MNKKIHVWGLVFCFSILVSSSIVIDFVDPSSALALDYRDKTVEWQSVSNMPPQQGSEPGGEQPPPPPTKPSPPSPTEPPPSVTPSPQPTTSIESCEGDSVHLVKQQDTILNIANQLGIWAHDLRIANLIPLNPYPPIVDAGTCLKIPPDPIRFNSRSPFPIIPEITLPLLPEKYLPNISLTACDYRVQYGDRLANIANRFGISLRNLIIANNIGNPNIIYTGQCLRFPTR